FDSMNNTNVSVSSGNLTILNDTEAPIGTITTSIDGENGIATLNATDDKSGLSGSYNWKISTSDVCDSSTTGFTTSTSLTYIYTISSSGNYYVCAKFSDNAGNVGYAKALAASSYIDYSYTGNYQTYTVPVNGYYQVETWGAQGRTSGSATSGLGSKTIGTLHLTSGEKIYVYVGGYESTSSGGYNGGGYTNPAASTGYKGVQGGGATDVRYFGSSVPSSSDLTWNSILGLNSRIMVAAGGGGAEWAGSVGGNGGGLTGGNGVGVNSYNDSTPNSQYVAKGGTQTAGGTAYAINDYSWTGEFGTGGYTTDAIDGGGMGGGGYYGGGSMNVAHGGGGGSSFISGYAGVNAITSSSDRTHVNNTLHYSNKYFVNGKMISGNNSGNGKAKITYIGTNGPSRINSKLDNVRYIKDCINGNTANVNNHWAELQAIYQGQNIAKGKTISTTSDVRTDAGTGTTDTIVDGIADDTSLYSAFTSGLQCITVDLGAAYDLDEIAVWHSSLTERTYNDNITYVSSDNVTWKNAITLVEAETSDGKRISAYEEDTTDDYAPTGTLSLSNSGFNVIANVSASDVGSGIKEYQYLIQSDASCSSSGYTTSSNTSYTFTVSALGTYYVCVRIKDNVGNVSEPISKEINVIDNMAPTINYLSQGGMKYTDPTFASGVNGISAYNNSGNGTVTVTRTSMSTSYGNYVLTIKTTGEASPGHGGFTFETYSSASESYITKIIAKIPVGYTIHFASNKLGEDYAGESHAWLTSQEGTGDWKEYVYYVKAHSTGTFGTTNYFYLSGGSTATSSSPVTWYVAYATVFVGSDGGTKGMAFNITDNESGVVAYGINQSQTVEPTWTSISTVNKFGTVYHPSSLGEYYVWAKDAYGNVSNKSITITNTTKNGAYFVNNRSSIANLSSSLVGGMYRFQGSESAVTNNYICFGTSSKSTCTGSPDYWMYRIIGVTSGGQIKVIKKTPLGGGSGNTYQWHNSSSSYIAWSGSLLYSNLNGSSFLTNTTYLPSGWSDKISTSNPWYFRSDNVAYGSTYMAYTGADMYTYETSDNSLTAKIGLMALHDYYLAPGNGTSCNSSGACTASWIHFTQNSSSYATSSEWTMARRGNISNVWYGIGIRSDGYATDSSSPVTAQYIVRPVFYIASSVNITSGTGTISDPYIIG
ncbi:MAG: glycine rich domain-containing protein, partial [Bacilli bacterium]